MAAAEVVFDYDATKVQYLALIKKWFDEESCHSATAIQSTIETLKTSPTSYLHKNFEVSHSFGTEILVEKRKTPDDPLVQVLSFEDIFDIFIKYHTANEHIGGRLYLMQVEEHFHDKYRYPLICLSILVKSCNVCKANNAQKKSGRHAVGSVYVTVMIQSKKVIKFRYLLIYIDKATNFVVLRPLREKFEMEIALELFKILMQFGPPEKLRLYGYNKDFNERVGIYLQRVCPMKFSIEYKISRFDPSSFVVDMLQEWMKENTSDMWEIGCAVVQRELNISEQFCPALADELLSPHDLLFGTMHPRTRPKKRIDARKNPEKDEDVVELRIPSPENECDFDILSQFEDTEASQERDMSPNENEIISDEDEVAIEDTASHCELDTHEEKLGNVLNEDMIYVPQEDNVGDSPDPLDLNAEVEEANEETNQDGKRTFADIKLET